ncbi:MAG: cytochrome P450 [Deltaproteobacteria bacterium]|nr:cytochrome P450 [Deltaproteobacteria bacterium]
MTSALARTPPATPGLPFIGSLYRMMFDPLHYLQEVPPTHGGLVKLGRAAGRAVYLVTDAEMLKEVLTQPDRFLSGPVKAFFKPLFRDGLVTSDGAAWRQQRKLIQPSFHPRRLAAAQPRMARTIAAGMESWSSDIDAGSVVDMYELLNQISMRVVLDAIFDLPGAPPEALELGTSVGSAMDYLYDAFWRPYLPPRWVPTPRNRRFARNLAAIDACVGALIEQRSGDSSGDDLLSILCRALGSADGLPREEVVGHLVSIIIGGFETTALVMTYALHLVHAHPDVKAQLVSEVDRVLGGDLPTVEHIEQLVYTRQVLDESMRIYPPAWLFGRTPAKDEALGGFAVPADANLLISPWAVHHRPDYWPDPERFDPSRFAADSGVDRHPFSYIPFGGGPRFCVGRNLALMEGVLLLAMFIQRFEYRTVRPERFSLVPGVTLRPAEGLPMVLTRR